MSANVVGGKLNLKGAPLKTLGQKKKKRKADAMALVPVDEKEQATSSAKGTPEKGTPEKEADTRTAAEKRYDDEMTARAQKRAKKHAEMSYRDRIDEFNAKVAQLSEHHDIPKVGPG